MLKKCNTNEGLTMALPSNIIKKSSPDPPCVTTTSPSSNETASKASATVNLSHLSKFSEIKFYFITSEFACSRNDSVSAT